MSIVYDFPAIAKHLRRDDFFTPSKPAAVEAGVYHFACFSCLGGIPSDAERLPGSLDIDYIRCPHCQVLNTISAD